MNLPATHIIFVDQTTPNRINPLMIGQKREGALDQSNFFFCFSDGQAKTVPICRPGQNIPKLDNILRAIAQADVLLK